VITGAIMIAGGVFGVAWGTTGFNFGQMVCGYVVLIAGIAIFAAALVGGTMTKDELKMLKNAIDARMESYLVEMRPDYDDSVTGFNEAWDIVRKFFAERIEKGTS